MNKVFIFDMDGVIINSEPVWKKQEDIFLAKLFGKKLYQKMNKYILGNTIDEIYKIATKSGFLMSKRDFSQIYDQNARNVYTKAKITNGIEELINKLVTLNFKLALVSASRKNWIDIVIKRLDLKKQFKSVLSLNDDQNIRPKPYPDGYLKSMKELKVSPKNTVILEDSNRGIVAAKSSGALTICLKENFPSNYIPRNADIYINKLTDLTQLLNILTL